MNPNPVLVIAAAVMLLITFMLEKAHAAEPARASVEEAQAQPPVAGELDGKAVVAVVRDQLRSLQGCYERALKRDPSLVGRIEVEFTISTAGGVQAARVAANAMPVTELGTCVVSRVRSWKFPASTGGDLTVIYPFDFAPLPPVTPAS